MNYRIWYSTIGFADYIIDNTLLKARPNEKRRLFESDAKSNEFHAIPDHIKKILYLDAHDLIIEAISPNGFEPIVSIEESKEAGTGHNSFQRFARLAASVENQVPTLYIYPEATVIGRTGEKKTWDKINPNIFKAMQEIMDTHNIPALLFYYPTFYNEFPDPKLAPSANKGRKQESVIRYLGCPASSDSQMQDMFKIIDTIILKVEALGAISARESLLKERIIKDKREWMAGQYHSKKNPLKINSPMTATVVVPTTALTNHLAKFSKTANVGELIASRAETVIYKIDGEFRGDPYPGALAALDYLMCRNGKSFEERDKNLAICFGDLTYSAKDKTITIVDNPDTKHSTIQDLTDDVAKSENRNLLSKDFQSLNKEQIPRYFMQMRYGSTFSKSKHIRVYSYFADAILFPDGALWREA